MASVFIGANRGALDMGSDAGGDGLTEAATTQSVDVEVQIAVIANQNRLEVVRILERIIRYIEDGRTAVLPL